MALVGIPIRLLHEAESHVITVELKNSEIYRGMLLKSQDNMNLELTTVTHTARDGQVQKMEQVSNQNMFITCGTHVLQNDSCVLIHYFAEEVTSKASTA